MKNKIDNYGIGKFCIVRCNGAGVFAGTVVDRDGDTVLMENARKLWRWDGAAAVEQISTDGTTAPKDCKFTVWVGDVLLTNMLQTIVATDEAKAAIEAVPEWKR